MLTRIGYICKYKLSERQTDKQANKTYLLFANQKDSHLNLLSFAFFITVKILMLRIKKEFITYFLIGLFK